MDNMVDASARTARELDNLYSSIWEKEETPEVNHF